MVARAQPTNGALTVTFSRDGEEPDSHHAADSLEASAVALAMITWRKQLFAGDTLTVHRADDDPLPEHSAELPEVSRSSHRSP